MMFPHKGFNWIGLDYTNAAIAQLGEHQTEDLKVPGSIPGLGMASSCRRLSVSEGCSQYSQK